MDIDNQLSLDWEILDAVKILTSFEELQEAKERELMTLLWKSRNNMTVKDMGGLIGWSRQTIYNKWRKYGFDLKE